MLRDTKRSRVGGGGLAKEISNTTDPSSFGLSLQDGVKVAGGQARDPDTAAAAM